MGFVRNRLVHVTLVILLLSTTGFAWDVCYEGDVLPNSSELGTSAWYLSDRHLTPSEMSSDGNTLHIADSSTATASYAFRGSSAFPDGTPVTMEVRVKLAGQGSAGPGGYPAGFGVSTNRGGGGFVGIWPDRIGTRYSNENAIVYHAVDMTQFHTFRLAQSSDARPSFWVWMDDQLIFSGISSGGSTQYSVFFGSCTYAPDALSDSHWDYVRYSTEFLPVPEPSALIAMIGGLGALGVPLVRRRR